MIERMKTNERLSAIVKHQGVVYLAGQLTDDDSKDLTYQSNSMLDKVDKLLEEAGSDRSRILSAIIYLKTMDDYADFNTIWNNWLPEGTAPTRTCVRADMARENIYLSLLLKVRLKSI